MGMVENQKKFYLYDRWFAYQNQIGERLVYTSIPNVFSAHMRIEINKKTNAITIFYLCGKKVIEKIEISDIEKPVIELYYIQEQCNTMEIDGNEYDNLSIELFTSIINNSVSREYQIKFIKKNKKSKSLWVAPSIPLNEKINISDLGFESEKVMKFINFSTALPIYIEKLRKIMSTVNNQEKSYIPKTVTEIVLPQELDVYDRTYHLVSATENKLVLINTEDGIRNLEIKYNPFELKVSSISLRIKEQNAGKGIIRIVPNKINGITARYCNKKKGQTRIGSKNLKTAKIHSDMIFNSDNKKVETNILICSKGKQIELLEHPYIKNNYTDGAGNLEIVSNSGYNIFYGIAAYAPGIFHYIEDKIFKTKVLKREDEIDGQPKN